MHSLQQSRTNQTLFYSKILSFIREAKVTKTRLTYPIIQGVYKNTRIKLVPEVDNLSLRSLPRLYLKIYVMLKNDISYRLYRVGKAYRLFVCGDEVLDSARVAGLLSQIQDASEILAGEGFVRIKLFLAEGDKNYYRVLRAAKFPALALNSKQFDKTINILLRLHKEVHEICEESLKKRCPTGCR